MAGVNETDVHPLIHRFALVIFKAAKQSQRSFGILKGVDRLDNALTGPPGFTALPVSLRLLNMG